MNPFRTQALSDSTRIFRQSTSIPVEIEQRRESVIFSVCISNTSAPFFLPPESAVSFSSSDVTAIFNEDETSANRELDRDSSNKTYLTAERTLITGKSSLNK